MSANTDSKISTAPHTPDAVYHAHDCLICGKELLYFFHTEQRTCELCHQVFSSDVACKDGHFVCDECHADGYPAFLSLLLTSDEKDPMRLFQQACALPSVHVHGPEHHIIVPSVLLTAYANNGGAIDLRVCLNAAADRGGKVPGGICGGWGVCGAAAGAGIYASIVTGSHPLNEEVWPLPLRLSARCLEKIAEVGGPRCCKRTSRLAIETAAAFTQEHFGVSLPLSAPACESHEQNHECLHERCSYYA